jgi:NSS family neurotransmitter:Na+ symporter
MAQQQGVDVSEVVAGGVGLAFVVFPQIISEFPAFNGLLGSIFFICLVLAGLTSLISIIETYVAGIQDKFKVSRNKAVAIGGGISAIISILFATQGGLYFLDAADYFINQFGIVVAGFVEVVLVAWVLREMKDLQQHADSMSDMLLGSWWKVCLAVVTPVVLGYMMIQNFINNLKENYEGYPTSFLLYTGWGVAVAAIVVGFVFATFKWQKGALDLPSTDSKEVSK